MVEGATSAALSGFEHNAVSPLGLKTPLPILLSAPIAKLPAGELWWRPPSPHPYPHPHPHPQPHPCRSRLTRSLLANPNPKP